MKLEECDYILGCWFAENDKGDNWLMTIKRVKDKSKDWEMEYRFRYKKDDKIWGSSDKKNWYGGIIRNQSEKEIIDTATQAHEIIKKRFSRVSKYVEVKGDLKRFAYLMAQEDWCNMKKLSGDEANELESLYSKK